MTGLAIDTGGQGETRLAITSYPTDKGHICVTVISKLQPIATIPHRRGVTIGIGRQPSRMFSAMRDIHFSAWYNPAWRANSVAVAMICVT
ncbi:MAG: hypothetical protein NTW75_18025 [Planctomycetales bacterium]|nr:hypothetical protein [Planctomycetales bacterium]